MVLQDQLDGRRTTAERNRLGQYATPTALARAIATFGVRLLPAGGRIDFLDPAVGTGAFPAALLAVAKPSRMGRLVGYEIDPHYGQPARALWRGRGLHILGQDFTAAAPPRAPEHQANLILCNPPYVRHHHLSTDDKARLQALARQRLGIRPSGLAGLYCHFLLLADAWLRPGGVAGWLVPGEWMDVKYGDAIRRYLGERIDLVQVHRFAPDDGQFDDALVSSTVIWLRKRAPRADGEARFTTGASLLHPSASVSVPRSRLCGLHKWSRLLERDAAALERPARTDSARFGELFAVKRGVATGANDFFILSHADIAARGLPWSCFRPVLPSPRYLSASVVQARANGDPDVARRLYLLVVRDVEDEDAVRARHPQLWRYLQEGRERGIPGRYLCRHRRPWFAQEAREPAPILCTYMGRRGARRDSPFRFIRNHSQALAANVYLLLYPTARLRGLMREYSEQSELLTALWRAMAQLPPAVLTGEGRVYGGGLYKLEPRELARVPLSALELPAPVRAALDGLTD